MHSWAEEWLGRPVREHTHGPGVVGEMGGSQEAMLSASAHVETRAQSRTKGNCRVVY